MSTLGTSVCVTWMEAHCRGINENNMEEVSIISLLDFYHPVLPQSKDRNYRLCINIYLLYIVISYAH